jgi:hypothetical protein
MPCTPFGQAVVVTVSVPWVPPLELLLLDDELLVDDDELPLLELPDDDDDDDDDDDELLLVDEPETSLPPLPPPQPAIARYATSINGPNGVRRMTAVSESAK